MKKEQIKKKIIDIVRKNPKCNRHELKKLLEKEGINLSYGTVREYVLELVMEGKLRMSEEVDNRRSRLLEVV